MYLGGKCSSFHFISHQRDTYVQDVSDLINKGNREACIYISFTESVKLLMDRILIKVRYLDN